MRREPSTTIGDIPSSSSAPERGRRDAGAVHPRGDVTLGERFEQVRARTIALCAPLAVEDFVVSSMPDVSPTKWHLAHTSWFFETFVLADNAPGYRSPDPRYAFLFNSYYVQAGERHCRAQRGLVTRPTVEEVLAYRAHVDDAMRALMEQIADDRAHPAYDAIVLGLHHEQQHQELLLTDIKHVFWMNPMRPVYRPRRDAGDAARPSTCLWRTIDAGVHRIGHDGGDFAFDNETPAHRVFVEPFRLATRLVTNAEYRDFIVDDGYRRPELWLSAGWATVEEERWEAPLYWERDGDQWTEFTLAGMRPVDPREPVCHLSYFEADAYARWAGARLPTEAEWEIAAGDAPVDGNFVESEYFHPAPPRAPSAMGDDTLLQLFGDVWQWTQSAYTSYPGFRSASGAIGEYNGKWMADQWVLRGASCATARTHARRTYRNFFPSPTRWQFTGIRLAAHP